MNQNVTSLIREVVEHFYTGPVKVFSFTIVMRDDTIHLQVSLEKIHDASTTD